MKVKCTPNKTVQKLTVGSRALGRVMESDVNNESCRIEAVADMIGDTFHLLYGVPQTKPANNCYYDRLVNRRLIEWCRNNKEFEPLFMETAGNLASSLAATGVIGEYLLSNDAIRRALEEQEPPPPPPPMPGAGGQPNNQGKNEQDKKDSTGGKNNQGKNDQGNKDSTPPLDSLEKILKSPVLSQYVNAAMSEAKDMAQETNAIMKTWGIEPPEVTPLDANKIADVARRNQDRIKEVSDLVGRIKKATMSVIQRTRDAHIGVASEGGMTRDYLSLFPTERWMLSGKAPKFMTMDSKIRFINQGLLGRRVLGQGKGEGSAVFLVDESGSMGGTQIVYAKAIAIGMGEAFREDQLNNRRYKIRGFSTDYFTEANDDSTWQEKWDWCMKQLNGGTDFSYALREGVRLLKEEFDSSESPDLVFITDGECGSYEDAMKEWKEFSNETGARLIYVDLGGSVNQDFKSSCDMYIKVSLNQEGDIETVIDGVASEMEDARIERLEDKIQADQSLD